jgi:hypothetical protein
MREMTEILVKSSQEATETINARIAATLDDPQPWVVDEVDGALAT